MMGGAPPPGSDVAAVRDLIDQYCRSIDAADTELAARIWSTSDDVSFIHPRGHDRGFAELRTRFYEQTMGERFFERKLTPHDISIHVYGDAAWAEFYWDFVARSRADGSILRTAGRETQVFQRGSDGWRLVHVQYSGRPVTGEREGF